jgi:hypothetical protein
MRRSLPIATVTLFALSCIPSHVRLDHALLAQRNDSTRTLHHPLPACPMPVARADSTVERPMPVVKPSPGAIPMPFVRPGCYNPLAPRR